MNLLLPLLVAQLASKHEITVFTAGSTAMIKLDPKLDPSATAWLNGKRIWSYIRREWQPWKLLKLDLEGDRHGDFIIALHKQTRHAKFRINTLFVFGFDGKSVFPKWRGSSMGRNFTDVIVVHGSGRDGVATIDRLLDGRVALSLYEWNGFGFSKIVQKGPWKTATFIQNNPDLIELQTDKGKVRFAPGTIWKASTESSRHSRR